MKPLTPGASDTTKPSAFCVCCVVFAISFLQEQSDLAPHCLQIYANNFSKYTVALYLLLENRFSLNHFAATKIIENDFVLYLLLMLLLYICNLRVIK